MKATVIKELTLDELKDKIVEETQNIQKTKMSHVISQIENPLRIRATRKLIARLNTELRKRELSASAK